MVAVSDNRRYTGRERRQRKIFRAAVACWAALVVLVLVLGVVR